MVVYGYGGSGGGYVAREQYSYRDADDKGGQTVWVSGLVLYCHLIKFNHSSARLWSVFFLASSSSEID